jgi:hypothetical protein
MIRGLWGLVVGVLKDMERLSFDENGIKEYSFVLGECWHRGRPMFQRFNSAPTKP